MAFGGETIDNLGVIRRFPAASMLTGTVRQRPGVGAHRTTAASAAAGPADLCRPHRPGTGRRRTDDRLPDRPTGCRRQRLDDPRSSRGPRRRSQHVQCAPPALPRLLCRHARDCCAAPSARRRNANTGRIGEPLCKNPNDRCSSAASPACLPPVCSGNLAEGDTALAALINTALDDPDSAPDSVKLLWPCGEGAEGIGASHTYMLTDQRNWVSGLHGGGRQVCEGSEKRERFGVSDEASTERSETP